jgi:predicted O-methyltransferase YrrM
MELPWFSYSAIRFLEGRLCGTETVYEYGGGGSTLFFARRVARVVTVENDAAWTSKLQTALDDRSLTNVELIRADGDFDNPASFGRSKFANALPTAPADVVVIDSYDFPPPHLLRPLLFPKAEAVVKPGGMIILDDAWRYRALRTTSRAAEVRTLAGVGPARKTVTSTDFYLYPG